MHAYLVPGITSEWSERLSTPCVGCGAPGVAKARWPERSLVGTARATSARSHAQQRYSKVPSAKIEKPSHNNGL
jgi:hypothetical protein